MSSQANAKISSGGLTAALVAQAAAGDRAAFATLYNEHKQQVLTFLVKRTRDRHLAEDLTSEVFIRALRNIHSFASRPGTGGFNAWLAVIARNLLIDYVKSSRFRLEVSVGDMYDGDARDRSAELSAMRQLDIAEATEAVTTAMQSLNSAQRRVVGLRYLQGLSIPEVAAEMGRAEGAVKTLTYRAMVNMRRALAPEAQEAVAA